MTERLSTLLHDEARAIAVPPSPTDEVLALGRRARRRRRAVAAGSVAAAVTAISGGAFLISSQPERPEELSVKAYREQGALAVDNELYVAGRHVPFEGAVKSFSYTAGGVVVQSGTSPRTDHADVDRYTLVRGDGSRTELDLESHDRVVATEPDSNRLAYAEPASNGRWAVVLVDVGVGAGDGEELSRTVVDRPYTWGTWEAPPVALDGDLVWARFDDGWTEVSWRSGAVRQVSGASGADQLVGGRYVARSGGRWTVRSMADDAVVSVLDVGGRAEGSLSPDGRFLRTFDRLGEFAGPDQVESFVYDVATGRRSASPPAEALGWTPNGDLLSLGEDGAVSTCVVGGGCTSTGLVVELTEYSTVKVGGNPYQTWDSRHDQVMNIE